MPWRASSCVLHCFPLSRPDRANLSYCKCIFRGFSQSLLLYPVSHLLPQLLTCSPRVLLLRWTLGSVLFLSSFAAMMGPWAYVQHLASGPRLPFTGAYFGSIALTLYFSIGLHSTILTLISAIIQLACLLWYLVSYFPMGTSGLRVATNFGARRAAAWMTG